MLCTAPLYFKPEQTSLLTTCLACGPGVMVPKESTNHCFWVQVTHRHSSHCSSQIVVEAETGGPAPPTHTPVLPSIVHSHIQHLLAKHSLQDSNSAPRNWNSWIREGRSERVLRIRTHRPAGSHGSVGFAEGLSDVAESAPASRNRSFVQKI